MATQWCSSASISSIRVIRAKPFAVGPFKATDNVGTYGCHSTPTGRALMRGALTVGLIGLGPDRDYCARVLEELAGNAGGPAVDFHRLDLTGVHHVQDLGLFGRDRRGRANRSGTARHAKPVDVDLELPAAAAEREVAGRVALGELDSIHICPHRAELLEHGLDARRLHAVDVLAREEAPRRGRHATIDVFEA